MGQYYLLVNLTKRQYVQPNYLGDGSKLMEFGSSSPGTMTALAVLLADGNGRGGGDLASSNPVVGSWAGDQIVVTGDYADDGKFVHVHEAARMRELEYRRYEAAKQSGAAISAAEMRWCSRYEKQIRDPATRGHNLYQVALALYEDVSDAVLGALMDDPPTRDALRDSTGAWVDADTASPNLRRLHGISAPTTRQTKNDVLAAARSMPRAPEGSSPGEPHVVSIPEDLPESPFDI